MKREILFRGFGLTSNEWVEGDLIHGVGIKSGSLYILPNKVNLAYVKNCDPLDGVQVHPDSVGQFTGLMDCNGAKIFEGDKLHRLLNVHFTVVFQNSKWIAIPKTDSDLYLDASQFKECEITGNTFKP